MSWYKSNLCIGAATVTGYYIIKHWNKQHEKCRFVNFGAQNLAM